IAIFAAGSALCGLSTSLPMILAMRALQGFGGAMPGGPPDPAAQLSTLRACLGDELDDHPGDGRADSGSDHRRLPDRLYLLARDILSQPADRHPRSDAGAVADRGFSRAGTNPV